MEGELLSLINELTQGKELARELCNHIISSSSSHETNEFLIEKILCSYEKALKMLKWGENVGEANAAIAHGSPRSDVLDEEDKHRDVFKKRKMMPRWTEKVKVCSGTGLEGALDDGYSWRKYGQKDILGSKFPRGYYRCTHRNVQGCLATKQVQRSDEDPTIYEVTYRGRHTCNNQASYLNKVSSSKTKIGLGENHRRRHHQYHESNYLPNEHEEENMEQPLETFFTFEPEHEVKMDDIFPSFGFPSSSENHFVDNFSADFISPSTSESNLLCVSPYHLGSAIVGQNVQSSESEVTEIVSAPNSVTNSPLVDLDLLLDKGDFQSNFHFNTFEFFSS